MNMMKKSVTMLVSLVALSGCMSTQPTTEVAAKNDQIIISQHIKPGIRACISYTANGVLDNAALTSGGYSTKGKSRLGGVVYDGSNNTYILLRERKNECSVNAVGLSTAARIKNDIIDTLNGQGFQKVSADRRGTIYSNGQNNIILSGSTVASYGFVGTTVTLTKG
jgi:hypothetical protein